MANYCGVHHLCFWCLLFVEELVVIGVDMDQEKLKEAMIRQKYLFEAFGSPEMLKRLPLTADEEKTLLNGRFMPLRATSTPKSRPSSLLRPFCHPLWYTQRQEVIVRACFVGCA